MIALVILITSLISIISFLAAFTYVATFFGFIAALLVLYLIRHRLLELILFIIVSGALEFWLVAQGLNHLMLVGIGLGIASFVWLVCKLIYHNVIEQRFQNR